MKVKILTSLALLVILGGLSIYLSRQSPTSLIPQKDHLSERDTTPSAASTQPKKWRLGSSSTQSDVPTTEAQTFDDKPLQPNEIEDYLLKNNRSADSLLAAFGVTENLEYLKEAAVKHPQNPRVQLAVICHDLFPEKKREWLNQYKLSSSTNALSYYLSARDYFLHTNLDLAFKDLVDASRNKFYEDYAKDTIGGLESIYSSTGKASASAKALALSNVPMPHLVILRELANHIALAQKDYSQRGDVNSAQTISQVGLEMAAQLNRNEGGVLLVNQLVGLAMENQFLSKLDPQTLYDDQGNTVKDRLEGIKKQRGEIKKLAPLVGEALSKSSESDIITYYEKVQKSGEFAALQWLAEQNTKKQ